MNELTDEDLEVILTSLEMAAHKIGEYQRYPSYEYKQQRLREVNNVRAKVLAAKRERNGK